MIYLIEKDDHTPQIMIDLGNKANAGLRELLDPKQERAVLDVSRRLFVNRLCAPRHLCGRTKIGDKTVDLKIPLSSILSVFARESGIGWRLSDS